MKKTITALLALILIVTLIPTPAYAATDEATAAANALYELGLFKGIGANADGSPDFDLDSVPTRHQAITMLVRLLGKEDEAQSKEWNTSFTDVVDWAKPYVGYAYANGLANGRSNTVYGGEEFVTPSEYITFVLRALGYDSSSDFQWNKAWELSDELGFTDGRYNANTTGFTRGDMAIIACNALSVKLKGTNTTLLEDLTASGVVHTHNWATRQVAEVGHYESSGTHTVMVYYCNCGEVFFCDNPDAVARWYIHSDPFTGCEYSYRQKQIEVPNDPQYVVDTPAHDETYCIVCGAVK